MSANRANLDDLGRNSAYIVLTIILIVLSLVGIVLFFQLQKTDSNNLVVIPDVSPIPAETEIIPVEILPEKPSPFLPISTVAPSTPTPTPTYQTFKSDTDGFIVTYKSNRKLYQDKEAGGNRYTLYSASGNIAIHAGTSWSWTYPDRQFSQSFLVAGYPTFIYETDTQTIVDFQIGSKLFTIQCIHGGTPSLKAECQQLLQDFKSN